LRFIRINEPGGVDLLLDYGADPRIGGIMGYTPLYYALQHGHHDTAEALVNNGALIDFYCLELSQERHCKQCPEFFVNQNVDLAEMAPTSSTLLGRAAGIRRWVMQAARKTAHCTRMMAGPLGMSARFCLPGHGKTIIAAGGRTTGGWLCSE